MMVNPDFTAYDSNNSVIATSPYNNSHLFSSHSSNKTTKKIKSVEFIPGSWYDIAVSEINVGLGWDFDSNDTYD